MTTTSMFSGLPGGEKPSSRVRAPPGGRSSNIFGVAEPAAESNQQQKKENVRPISNVFGDASTAQVSTPQHDNVKKGFSGPADNVKSILFGADSTQQQVNAAASSVVKKKRTGVNPITGRRYEEEDAEEEEKKKKAAAEAEAAKQQNGEDQQKAAPKEEEATKRPAAGIYTSSKVLQPPGGRSTRLW